MMNLTQKNDIDCRNEKIKSIVPHVGTHTSEGEVLRQYGISRGFFAPLMALKM
ncbi:MAG: hypothetical protein WCE81_13180 [Halobacteriota archaeon]